MFWRKGVSLAGIYTQESAFGKTPPDENRLVESFLKDNRFLLTSPNAYNSLGVGTTQFNNVRNVYNHKRHGEFRLRNKIFHFQIKPHFPKKVTPEFLLVDLVNNLHTLAEDSGEVMKKVAEKVATMDKKKLKYSVTEYGNVKTKKMYCINTSNVTLHTATLR